MSDFKEKIYELIIDEENQELNFEDFGYNIQKWPEITYYNEEDDCMEYEVLGIENISLIDDKCHE